MLPHPGDRRAEQAVVDDIEFRAFRTDRDWYERHWYGPVPLVTSRRPGAGRSPVSLALVSIAAAWLIVWL